MKKTKLVGVMLTLGLLGASYAHAQSADTSAARCAELSAGVKTEFDKRLLAMAPKIAPGVYVNQNTDALKILNEQVGGGNFLGLNIGSLISGVSSKYLGSATSGATFSQGINGILSSWGAPGSLATPGFAPQAAAALAPAQAQPAASAPGFLQRIFGGSSTTASSPYQR